MMSVSRVSCIIQANLLFIFATNFTIMETFVGKDNSLLHDVNSIRVPLTYRRSTKGRAPPRGNPLSISIHPFLALQTERAMERDG